jgi:hypothetical protein
MAFGDSVVDLVLIIGTVAGESRPGKFRQGAKWISGLRAARMPQDQEEI